MMRVIHGDESLCCVSSTSHYLCSVESVINSEEFQPLGETRASDDMYDFVNMADSAAAAHASCILCVKIVPRDRFSWDHVADGSHNYR